MAQKEDEINWYELKKEYLTWIIKEQRIRILDVGDIFEWFKEKLESK